MSVVVDFAGSQLKVDKNSIVNIPLQEGQPGETKEFNKIWLVEENNEVKIGNPYIDGTVQAKIIEHGRDKKILVFHKKRRKGYRKLNGHRQKYTQVEITDININN